MLNVRLLGETPATAPPVTPVPVKLTVCGLLLALSVKLSEALKLVVADGVNVTLTVQVLLGVTVAPVQVSALMAKSLGFVPPIMTVEMVRLAVPVLVTVSGWAGLVVLVGWLAKLKLEAEKLTAAAKLVAKLDTRFETLTVPIPVAKSHPVAAGNAG